MSTSWEVRGARNSSVYLAYLELAWMCRSRVLPQCVWTTGSWNRCSVELQVLAVSCHMDEISFERTPLSPSSKAGSMHFLQVLNARVLTDVFMSLIIMSFDQLEFCRISFISFTGSCQSLSPSGMFMDSSLCDCCVRLRPTSSTVSL